MQVSDIHGFGRDFDLNGLDPTWPVDLVMMDVYPIEWTSVASRKVAEKYADIYREFGPWGLPPVVCVGDTGWQVAGAHRMAGAHLAEIKQIPAFIVHVPRGDDR